MRGGVLVRDTEIEVSQHRTVCIGERMEIKIKIGAKGEIRYQSKPALYFHKLTM